jgi:hypothetical protein
MLALVLQIKGFLKCFSERAPEPACCEGEMELTQEAG